MHFWWVLRSRTEHRSYPMSPAIRKARKNAIEEQKSWKRASAKGW